MEIAAVALSVVAFLLLVVAAALRPLLPGSGSVDALGTGSAAGAAVAPGSAPIARRDPTPAAGQIPERPIAT